ncbi:MAG: M14 metallopeptidase family protein [Bacteroidota bacterium]
MHRIACLCLLLWSSWSLVSAQPNTSLDYYLPATSYDENIPSPESVLGYPVGKWHATHDQLVHYLTRLAEAAPRVRLETYARSHEDRPLILLTISSTRNLDRLESIRTEHLQLTDPQRSDQLDLTAMPAVVYQGYTIHGNEASGANAALLVAYYLAAGQGPEVEALLENTVILLDPCYNPDGLHRFSTWVNMHKSKSGVTDPNTREFGEVWPGGRTNHYWFDLNRDWLLLTHPESRGRIRNFHRWKPNILTDHHEMGSNSTYFFQPGVPSRTNPLTPEQNQELTGKIGDFHAAALDEIGSQYYTRESFDDFYYGKGSTYPDINACIGILFEQASSRGHLRETSNGLLSFPFTIRNQVRTSLSTLRAARELRPELLEFQRQFFRNAAREARADDNQAYVYTSSDRTRLYHFNDILERHQIEHYPLAQDLQAGGQDYTRGQAFVVPLQQQQYRLIKAIFSTSTEFRDSIFYDVSAWTMPLAFDLDYTALTSKTYRANLLGDPRPPEFPTGQLYASSAAPVGYLFSWEGYYAPKALQRIFTRGLRAKLATRPFSLELAGAERSFGAGTVFVPLQNQALSPAEIKTLMSQLAEDCGIDIWATATGLTPTGIDLGSPSMLPLKKPGVLMVVGPGASAYDAGEVWHLLDTRYEVPVTMVEGPEVAGLELEKYSVIVLVDGSHGSLNRAVEPLKRWVQSGGVIVAMERAVNWVRNNGLVNVELRKEDRKKRRKERRPYGQLSSDRGAEVIGGAIFQTELDLSHPLCYGFGDADLSVFRQGKIFMELPTNPYAAPLVYTAAPLRSGYISSRNLRQLQGTAAVVVGRMGQGRVICLADNPNFRGFWYGTNKLFANALFFGNLISSRSAEMPKEEEEEEE